MRKLTLVAIGALVAAFAAPAQGQVPGRDADPVVLKGSAPAGPAPAQPLKGTLPPPPPPDTFARGQRKKNVLIVRFSASQENATFSCRKEVGKLRKPVWNVWKRCESPHKVKLKRPGERYRVFIRAEVGAAVDPSPARVVARAPSS